MFIKKRSDDLPSSLAVVVGLVAVDLLAGGVHGPGPPHAHALLATVLILGTIKHDGGRIRSNIGWVSGFGSKSTTYLFPHIFFLSHLVLSHVVSSNVVLFIPHYMKEYASDQSRI